MKNFHIYKFLFWMAIFTCYITNTLANNDTNLEQKSIPGKLGKTLQKMSAKGAYGKLLIARGKDIFFNQDFGSPAKRKKIKNQFMIGCISKLFTASALLKLVERSQLDINDPISKYLPEDDSYWQGAPPKWIHEVTIHQLLNHTSGIQEYLFIKGFEPYYKKIQTTATVMQFIAHAALTFKPGSKYEYNSSAYLVLGAMIERISGKAYGNFIEDEFLKPLKMTDTIVVHDRFLYDLFKEHPNINRGFNLENGKLVSAPDVNLSTVFSEASIITSAEDLFKWSYALFHGEVINKCSLTEMLNPHVKRKDGYMGYGVFIGETPNHNRIFFHDGEISGYQAFLIYVPDKDITLIMLSCVRNWKCRDLLFEIVDEFILEDK